MHCYPDLICFYITVMFEVKQSEEIFELLRMKNISCEFWIF